MKHVLLLFVAVILFGSWFPFRFDVPSNLPGWELLADWPAQPRRGDVLANLLLYAPFGFFWQRALSLQGRAWRPIAAAALAGVALSITAEGVQIFIPGRTPSIVDVVCNTSGAALGALAATFSSGRRLFGGARAPRPMPLFPLLLAAAWLGYRLFPFVPTIDWQKFKNALKPLLLDPSVSGIDLAHLAVSWLVFGRLLAALQPGRHIGALVALSGGFVLLAKIPVVQQSVGLAEVLAVILAASVWTALGNSLVRRPALLAALMGVIVVANALAPFTLRSSPASFHWLPFYGFLGGGWIEVSIRSFMEKLFTYGALLWLMVQARLRLLPAALALAGLLFALELAQVMLVGRTPEITDPVIVLLLAVIMRSIDEANLAFEPRRTTA